MKNFVRILLFVPVFTFVFCINAIAGNPCYWDNSLQGNSGVANRTYYIDQSAKIYKSAINAAIKSWESATSKNSAKAKVSFTQVNSANATIVFKATSSFPSYVPSGSKAYVDFFSGSWCVSDTPNPPKSSWTNCTVYLLDNLGSQAQGTIGHEIGHCFGLSHPPSSYGLSIMHPSTSSNHSKTPTALDTGNLEAKY